VPFLQDDIGFAMASMTEERLERFDRARARRDFVEECRPQSSPSAAPRSVAGELRKTMPLERFRSVPDDLSGI